MGKFSVLSINPGIGLRLLGYQKAGAKVHLALERDPESTKCLTTNVCKTVRGEDPRWFYNRKERGTHLLLEGLGLKEVGDLDLLDAVAHSPNPYGSEQNLFDVFGIARRLLPKVVITFAPVGKVWGANPETKSPQSFHTFLDYLRYPTLKHRDSKQYLVCSAYIDSADWGSAISKRLCLIVGVRVDVAASAGIASEQTLRGLLPKSTALKAIGDAISGVNIDADTRMFLQQTIQGNFGVANLVRLVEKDPKAPVLFTTTKRVWSDFGFTEKNRPKVVRAASEHPLPDVNHFDIVLHPNDDRPLAVEELRVAMGVPENFALGGGTHSQRWKRLCNDVPIEVTQKLTETLISPVLRGKPKISAALSLQEEMRKGVERLEVKSTKRWKVFASDVDEGTSVARGFISKAPTGSDYDYIFDADEIDQDFVVLGPYDYEEGRRVTVGALKRKVFTGDSRDRCVATISKIRDKTDKRVNECPLEIPDELLARWKDGGTEVQVSPDKRKFKRKSKNGRWDETWRSVPIPTSAIGWTRDKITGLPQRSKVLDNPQVMTGFDEINTKATSAYRYLAIDDFVKQEKFVRKRIVKSHTLSSVFTTMSVNRYGSEMPAMNYHIDQGDDASGLTTISVFHEGYHEGGLFVIPRFRCAFRIGDGDVFVANSRQVHGVSEITGNGRRLSVVSYNKTSLASKENMLRAYPALSPRPKFRVDRYQVAIPSYMREQTLLSKTLKVLQDYGVDPRRVTIFVANKTQLSQYQKALSDSPYTNLVIAQKGIMQVRNFMWNYYAEGTPVLFMDDDIQEIQRLIKPRGKKAQLRKVKDFYEEVVIPGFMACREYNAYLWGIYAATNPLFMDASKNGDEVDEGDDNPDEIVVGNQYIIGSFFGAVIRHQKNLLVGCSDKEDHERSVLHFIQDGRTVKLKYLTVKSNYYGEPGGLQATRTLDTVASGAKYMQEHYPKFVRIEKHTKTIKNGPLKGEQGIYWEVKHI